MGGLAKSPKLINKEVGINREAGKNTAIRNFIEIKSSNDLVKISTKRTGSLSAWKITCSFAQFSSSCYVVLCGITKKWGVSPIWNWRVFLS